MGSIDVRDSGLAIVNIMVDEYDMSKDTQVVGVIVTREEQADGKDIGLYACIVDGSSALVAAPSDNVVWLLADDYVYTK